MQNSLHIQCIFHCSSSDNGDGRDCLRCADVVYYTDSRCHFHQRNVCVLDADNNNYWQNYSACNSGLLCVYQRPAMIKLADTADCYGELGATRKKSFQLQLQNLRLDWKNEPIEMQILRRTYASCDRRIFFSLFFSFASAMQKSHGSVWSMKCGYFNLIRFDGGRSHWFDVPLDAGRLSPSWHSRRDSLDWDPVWNSRCLWI